MLPPLRYVLFQFCKPSFDERTIFFIILAEIEEIGVNLRHIKTNGGGVVIAEFFITGKESGAFLFGFKKFLAGAENERPGNIKIAVTIARKLEIKDPADVMFLPKDVRIVEIPVAKAFGGIFRRGGKEIPKVRKPKLFKKLRAWGVEKAPIRHRGGFDFYAVELREGFTVFFHIGKGFEV